MIAQRQRRTLPATRSRGGRDFSTICLIIYGILRRFVDRLLDNSKPSPCTALLLPHRRQQNAPSPHIPFCPALPSTNARSRQAQQQERGREDTTKQLSSARSSQSYAGNEVWQVDSILLSVGSSSSCRRCRVNSVRSILMGIVVVL